MPGGASRIPEDGARSLSETVRGFSTGWGHCFFLLGKACFFQKKWLLWHGIISQPQELSSCSLIILPQAFHPRPSSRGCRLCFPPFAQTKGEWLVMQNLGIGPLEQKEGGKKVVLSLADSVFFWQTPWPLTAGCCVGR